MCLRKTINSSFSDVAMMMILMRMRTTMRANTMNTMMIIKHLYTAENILIFLIYLSVGDSFLVNAGEKLRMIFQGLTNVKTSQARDCNVSTFPME
jgi:hypothetical protein